VLKHAAHPGSEIQTVLDSGVDLFFAISGFVMVVSTSGRDMSGAEFIAKRCRRILPMWWLTLLIVGALGLGSGGFRAWSASFAFLPRGTVYGVASVYWGVGWTLLFETIFYVFFALGLALKFDKLPLILLPALAAFGVLFGRPSNPILNDLTHPMLLEFVMGAIVGRVIMASRTPSPLLIPLGALLLVLGGHFGIVTDWRPFTIGLPAAMILAGAARLDLPRLHSLKVLGDSSYSIYLLHYAAILILWRFTPPNSLWPITAAAGIGLGLVAYYCAERPMLNALSRKSSIQAVTSSLSPGH
jgi:exopolysaccharide production protein ExoZ